MFGGDVSEEDASALQAAVREAYPDVDVELFYGGQAIYYYIVSLE